MATTATQAVQNIWQLGGLDPLALEHLSLPGTEPVLPSSFAVGTAAQAGLAAAALASAEVRYARGRPRQAVSVQMHHAAMECTTYFTLDGVAPNLWDKLSGLYRCGTDAAARWVRVHANFFHHRDGVLRLLDLPVGDGTDRAKVEAALQSWDAFEFEQEASRRGLVVAAVRSFEEWDAHPQSMCVARLPLLEFERFGDAPARLLPSLSDTARPLSGVKVLELTRVLAGPVAGRTLAAYGAEVMLVNGPHLPNIEALVETSRGKLSSLIDLRESAGRDTLRQLVAQSHVFIQGYRPGGLADLGFSPEDVARICPGTIYVSLSAYGSAGPWSNRKGFDSLVQSTTGFNIAEAQAAGVEAPKAMPVQILDHASGQLMAFAAQAALIRQQREGGSWHVRVSLAQTGHWLRSLGRITNGLAGPKPSFEGLLESSQTGFGTLVAVRHAAQLDQTPARWSRPSMPPGTHPPVWPAEGG
jgi:CoA-transferase family III